MTNNNNDDDKNLEIFRGSPSSIQQNIHQHMNVRKLFKAREPPESIVGTVT